MGDSVENQANTSGVPPTPKSTVSIMDMLTSDGKSFEFGCMEPSRALSILQV